MDSVRISVKEEDLQKLINKYGQDVVQKAINITKNYTERVSRDAKKIVKEENKINTGQLVNSIKPSIKIYASRITGTIKAGAKHARFIHEGAYHESDTEIVPFFVPFSVAPSLLNWAMKKKVIVNEDGEWRLAKTGQKINIKKGGLKVRIEPTFFLRKPFEEHVNNFMKEMNEVVR